MPSTKTDRWEVWMYLPERGRERLLEILEQEEISRRRLAIAAGWSSHSYMNRLLNGEVSTLEVKPAVRIAKFLGLRVNDLFLPKSTSDAGRTSQRKLANTG